MTAERRFFCHKPFHPPVVSLLADGRRRYFAIQFYKKNGELVTLSRARSCGLRMNMTDNRTRGVQQVDDHGNAVGHIYPVCIDNIRTFNNIRVKI